MSNNDNLKPQAMQRQSGFSPPAQRPQIQPMQPVLQPKGFGRWLLTLSVPGFVIVACVGLGEVFLPHEWKPSVLIAKAMASYEVTMIRDTLIDRAQAEQQIAEARAEGERSAELEFQAELRAIEFDYAQRLATVQTNLQTGLASYQSLFERTNMIYQGALQMENTILTQQQAAVRDTQGGQAFLANGADLLCPLMPELCEYSDRVRADMANDLVTAGRTGRGTIVRDLMIGVEDPASLRARLMPQEPEPVVAAR